MIECRGCGYDAEKCDCEFRRKMTKLVDGKPQLADEFKNLVVEVRGQEITKNGRLRHPMILKYRPEMQPIDCKVFVDLKNTIVRQA